LCPSQLICSLWLTLWIISLFSNDFVC
jgi:hypothetical protein